MFIWIAQSDWWTIKKERKRKRCTQNKVNIWLSEISFNITCSEYAEVSVLFGNTSSHRMHINNNHVRFLRQRTSISNNFWEKKNIKKLYINVYKKENWEYRREWKRKKKKKDKSKYVLIEKSPTANVCIKYL